MNKHYYGNTDLTGQKFHRLTAIQKVKGTRSRWICKCECGKIVELVASDLINGLHKSCGCLERENQEHLAEKARKHGMTNSILYSKWCGMKERCFNSNYRYFHRYGGRGITICDEWLGEHGFENFAKWAYENGYDENKNGYEQSIDRKDTDGDYCPENCKWSTQLEQVKNRSNSFLIKDVDGEKLTHVQFSIKHNIPPKLLFVYRRMKKGINAKDILDEWDKYVKCKNGNYYTVKELTHIFNVRGETITSWIRSGRLKGYQIRNTWYVPKDQVNLIDIKTIY